MFNDISILSAFLLIKNLWMNLFLLYSEDFLLITKIYFKNVIKVFWNLHLNGYTLELRKDFQNYFNLTQSQFVRPTVVISNA